MALFATHKETKFGVGDTIKVNQRITDGDKTRIQTFEGMVLRIKGRENGKSFIVRRIGAQQVGIERIYPLISPIIESIEVVKHATSGIKRSKLYYTRKKSRKEISKIQSRSNRRTAAKKSAKETHADLTKKTTKKEAEKKVSKAAKKTKKTSTKKSANASKKK